jgi:hypothetical protein
MGRQRSVESGCEGAELIVGREKNGCSTRKAGNMKGVRVGIRK